MNKVPVEGRMSAFSVKEPETSKRQQSKLSLPFTILNMPESTPVLHLFEIQTRKVGRGGASSKNSTFGVATTHGYIGEFDTLFRRIKWKQQTTLAQVTGRSLSWMQTVNPRILVQGQIQGFPPVIKHVLKSDSNSSEPLPSVNIGFCKPYQCSDKHLLVPIENQVWIQHQGQRTSQACHSFKAMIMAIKEIVNLDSSRYIICSTEDGYVHLMEAGRKPEDGGGDGDGVFQMKSLSKLLLPNYEENGQQPIGTCIEGDGSIFVIGSNLKYMFLLKWSQDEPKSLQPFGKKILPTEGVNCMAMREGRGILAAGCFDGTVRIFGFPEMSQISTINYHKTQINTLLFINEKLKKDGRWYLLCGASDSGVSVWNI